MAGSATQGQLGFPPAHHHKLLVVVRSVAVPLRERERRPKSFEGSREASAAGLTKRSTVDKLRTRFPPGTHDFRQGSTRSRRSAPRCQ